MTMEVTILNHRVPIRRSITLSPPSEESSEMRKCGNDMTMWRCAIQSIINRDRLQTLISGYIKPGLRGYACLTYGQQVTPLLSYLTVDKTISAGLN